MALIKDASAGDVFKLRELRPILTILFVDESDLCKRYISIPWVSEEAEVIFVDQAIEDIFKIRLVPQYRFFVAGDHVSSLVGNCSREIFLKFREEAIGNVRILRPKRSPKNAE